MAWIERYGHGGDRITAAESFQVEMDRLIDFSANINPLGPPENIIKLLHEELSNIIHYPDPSQRLFRKTVADNLGINETWVLAGNGAAESMNLTIQALQPESIGLVYPCFSEYEKLAASYQIPTHSCIGKFENNYKADMVDCYDLFDKSDLVFVGHPNNPTGAVYTKQELLQMANWTEQTNTYLVVDEAFIDFIPHEKRYTLLTELKQFPKVILIRSMTKFFAIPGLRLGYMIAHPQMIKKAEVKQVTWSVNQLSLSVGVACFKENLYEKETIALVEKERSYLSESLSQFFYVFPGQANFLLLRIREEMKVDQLQYQLGKKGIMIRSCAMYPGLTDRDFRIAVRTRNENQQLIEAITDVLAKRS